MSGENLPEEIVQYIFTFAFYPHQYPFNKTIIYNKCMNNLPKIVKQDNYDRHPIFTYPFIHFKHKLSLLGKYIFIDQCENFRYNIHLIE